MGASRVDVVCLGEAHGTRATLVFLRFLSNLSNYQTQQQTKAHRHLQRPHFVGIKSLQRKQSCDRDRQRWISVVLLLSRRTRQRACQQLKSRKRFLQTKNRLAGVCLLKREMWPSTSMRQGFKAAFANAFAFNFLVIPTCIKILLAQVAHKESRLSSPTQSIFGDISMGHLHRPLYLSQKKGKNTKFSACAR